ncbi:hypothetical protein IGI04_015139 [Brassica rapa subsp. trilocularis]|uniref:Secreted protein n=1 Tax=Brassica rapa subsp. trilocularis TaxID=1813537 RepID=A0ABQ7MP72_BRACM|nr:hypothetical protein IGI04_015139 [Brassica rapa subsp. trilocularis]
MLVLRFFSSPLTSALPELWFGVVKLFVVTVDVPFPGGGGSYSSVAVGPCLREVEATSAPPSSVLSPEGEGSLSLASPVLGVSVSSNEISIGSMMLSEVKTKCGREELVRMEALRFFELEVCGGVALGDDSRR